MTNRAGWSVKSSREDRALFLVLEPDESKAIALAQMHSDWPGGEAIAQSLNEAQIAELQEKFPGQIIIPWLQGDRA